MTEEKKNNNGDEIPEAVPVLGDGVPGIEQLEPDLAITPVSELPKTPKSKEFYKREIGDSVEGQQTGNIRIVGIEGKLVSARPFGRFAIFSAFGVNQQAYVVNNSNPVPGGSLLWIKNIYCTMQFFPSAAADVSGLSIRFMVGRDKQALFFYQIVYPYLLSAGAVASSINFIKTLSVTFPVDFIIPKESIVNIIVNYAWTGGTAVAPRTELNGRVFYNGFLFKEPMDMGKGNGTQVTNTLADFTEMINRYTIM